jgi:hypothetical protein
MSDENLNHGHSGHQVEFEHEDLGTRGVFTFLIGLAVVGIVIYFIIVGMYKFLDNYEISQSATASPLVTSRDVSSRFIKYDPGNRSKPDYVDTKFKDNGAPMLEIDERTQLRDYLTNQEIQLNTYGWVDKDAGVAHIPIERAMELLVQRGVPVHSAAGSQGAASLNASAAAKTPEHKSPEKGNSSAH